MVLKQKLFCIDTEKQTTGYSKNKCYSSLIPSLYLSRSACKSHIFIQKILSALAHVHADSVFPEAKHHAQISKISINYLYLQKQLGRFYPGCGSCTLIKMPRCRHRSHLIRISLLRKQTEYIMSESKLQCRKPQVRSSPVNS